MLDAFPIAVEEKMAWQKSPPELIARFEAFLPDRFEVERRKMFGNHSAFANGNMFAGLFEDYMILRLGDAERAVLTAMEGGGLFEPKPGHRMKEYARVPSTILADDAALADWIARSFAFAAALPPKEKKPRRSKKKV